jgi:preprotein translocase subunit SecD
VTALAISQGNGAPGRGSMAAQTAVELSSRLAAGAGRRTEYVGGRAFSVARGYVLLQAAKLSAGHPVGPNALFYLLRDLPAFSGGDIANPRQSTDATAAPNIAFDLTAAGKRAFGSLTAALARRGQTVSSLSQTLNQHFAVTLDNELIALPEVDFRQYPDGIPANAGVALEGVFTVQSARDLATVLRYGPLSVSLKATG